ncbi:MAG: hypothetical protein GY937_27385 [bacterium]|nr:hypothetical protein [bacterium]
MRPSTPGFIAALVGLLLILSPSLRADAACEEPAGELLALGAEGVGGTGRGGQQDGIGGTGRETRDPGDGIGGTGREVRDPVDGIGGSGLADDGLGGTGLFGTLTGFGSLCVNGHEITLDPSVPVTLAGESASVDVLRVGQVLWLVAQEEGGTLRATHVDVFLAAAGTIERVESGGHDLQVAGRAIAVPEDALVVDGVSGMPVPVENLRVGERVAVSGLVNADGVVLASRIERRERAWPKFQLPDPAELARTAGLSRVSVEGLVQRGPGGRLQVGSFSLALGAEAPQAAALTAGARVWVQGKSEGARLTVEQIRLPAPKLAPRPRPTLPPGARVEPPRTMPAPQPRDTLHQPSVSPAAPRPSSRPGPDRPRKLEPARIRAVPTDAKLLDGR